MQEGKIPDALAEYEAAIRIKPDYLQAALLILGDLLVRQGKIEAVIAHYEAILRINPQFSMARQKVEVLRNLQGKNMGHRP